jgi:hypothetical protein
MATYAQQMQAIFDQYRQEVSSDPADLKDVGIWALAKGLWKPRPVDMAASFAREMAECLREEMRTDKVGRRYRAKIAARITKGGLPLFVWADIDDAPRSHVEKGTAQKRQQLVDDGFRLRMDVDHYNWAHPAEEPIQLILDITEDVEERIIAEGIGKDEDAA